MWHSVSMPSEPSPVGAVRDPDSSLLPTNAVVGRDVFIESPKIFSAFRSQMDPGLVLGDRVRFYLGGWGGSVSVEPDGVLEIGDDSVLVGAQFMCAERITLGRRVVVSYNAVIADSDFHPRDPLLRRHDAISGAPFGSFVGYTPRFSAPVMIEDDVVIGINAIILKGVRVGTGAEIGPGAVVTRDVPAGAFVVGNPAQIVDR